MDPDSLTAELTFGVTQQWGLSGTMMVFTGDTLHAVSSYAGTARGWRTDDDWHGRSDDIPAVDDTAEVTMIVDGTEVEVFFGDSLFFDTDSRGLNRPSGRRHFEPSTSALGSAGERAAKPGTSRVELRKGR